jgi:molecular chaperone IbpA
MNTRRVNLDLLNDPFFIGFDNLLNKLHTANAGIPTPNYPPYNLIKTGEDTYLIELAVAGFDENDFDIELHDGVLTVRADVWDSESSTKYLHKGIAARSFVRRFTLADTIVVDGVSLHQGVLTISLNNVIPEEKKPKKILIGKTPERELLTE